MLVLLFFHEARSHILLGDAAIYAHQIETHNFSERTLHFLYYVVGWLFLQLARPLGVPTDEALIAMSSVLMTLALWLSWMLYRELGEDQGRARWALFVLLFSGVVIQQATEAEVYALQLVLSLAAYLLYVRNHPAPAGVALGLATLTTPLGVLAVGFFVVEAIRTRQWKPFVIAGVFGALTYLPVLAVVWRDYFYGTRGLMVDKTGIVQSWGHLLDNVVAIAKNFHWLLPFLAVGLWIAWRERSRMLALLVGLLIFHIPAVITVTENGVFVLPVYPFFAAIIARGVEAGLRAGGPRRTVTGAALALYAATSLLIWMQPYDRKFRDGLVEGLRRCPPGSTVLSTWSFDMTLEFYGGPPRDTLLASRRLVHPSIVKKAELLEIIRSGQPVFLMEAHYPTRAVRWLYPSAVRERHYDENALMPRMRRAFGVEGTPVFNPRGGPIVYRLAAP